MDHIREGTACAAPFVAMEFDQFGDVQACCANALFPLGNVATTSLREIWTGPRATALRDAVRRRDLNFGCGVCRYRLDHGYGELPRDYYDNFPMTSYDPEWPYSLQFSLHNTCNLECVMCGADRSSKIRSRRDHLEPLPHAYDDRFFAEIEPFLQHAGFVDFSGGEPFLVAEHFRIWEILASLERQPACGLTTNGTVWNERVEGVLDSIDSHICVSIDGVRAETVESIRVGADFDAVMENLDRFEQYANRVGTELTISFSLVRQNWFEMGLMMRFAEDRGIRVKVQTVIEPEFGVQRLSTSGLEFVVESLEAEGRSLLGALDLNRDMWLREVARLRRELDERRGSRPRLRYMEPPDPANADHVAAVIGEGTTGAVDPDAKIVAAAELSRWSGSAQLGSIELDHRGRVTALDLVAVLPPEAHMPELPNEPTLGDVLRAIERALDGKLWIGDEVREPGRVLHTLWVGRPVRDKMGLILRFISVPSGGGIHVNVAADGRLLPASNQGVPVTLGARSHSDS